MLVDARDVFINKYANTVKEVTAKQGQAAGQARIAHLPINDRIKINLMLKGVRSA